ncbi:MAG: hypothetical protein AB1714_11745 [Acidobacteriota bacterium]
MSDQPSISVEDCTIFLRTLSFDAEPGLTLEIVDRWRDGDRVNVRLRHPADRACESFSVVQAIPTSGRRYLVLHTWRAPVTCIAHILVALPDPDHVVALVPEEYQALSRQLADVPVNDDFSRVVEYLGEVPDLTAQIRSREQSLSRDLTTEICLPYEPVPPGSRLTIVGKRQYEGCVFLTLKRASGEPHTDPLLLEFLARTNRLAVSTQDFSLRWIAEVYGDTFVVLSYPSIRRRADICPAPSGSWPGQGRRSNETRRLSVLLVIHGVGSRIPRRPACLIASLPDLLEGL